MWGFPAATDCATSPKARRFRSWRTAPFATLQPYAETGPIFLFADPCARFDGEGTPPILAGRETVLIRGYSGDERIVYGTGRIVPTDAIPEAAAAILADARAAFLHARSARNGCFQVRIDRA